MCPEYFLFAPELAKLVGMHGRFRNLTQIGECRFESRHANEEKLKIFSAPRAVRFLICTLLERLCGDAANCEDWGRNGSVLVERK